MIAEWARLLDMSFFVIARRLQADVAISMLVISAVAGMHRCLSRPLPSGLIPFNLNCRSSAERG
jgi:hypothetical protein